MASKAGNSDDDVGSVGVDLENCLQIEERVELAGVPDHSLSGRGAKEGDEYQLEIRPMGERISEGLGRVHARSLDLRVDRRFLHADADIEGDH